MSHHSQYLHAWLFHYTVGSLKDHVAYEQCFRCCEQSAKSHEDTDHSVLLPDH